MGSAAPAHQIRRLVGGRRLARRDLCTGEAAESVDVYKGSDDAGMDGRQGELGRERLEAADLRKRTNKGGRGERGGEKEVRRGHGAGVESKVGSAERAE